MYHKLIKHPYNLNKFCIASINNNHTFKSKFCYIFIVLLWYEQSFLKIKLNEMISLQFYILMTSISSIKMKATLILVSSILIIIDNFFYQTS